MLACLLTHEMDAVRAQEWRLLPILKALPDAQGREWFIAVHGPLYVLLLWGLAAAPAPTWMGLAVFGIIHLGLHVALRKHPKYGFTHWQSWVWIAGWALAGAAYLLAV